ncbi:MAG: ZPR1 zinc finger domain-containing protein [Candidatus Diapherotrites archaeon]|nr:ZPR1 zinc finger domain-containing protein [Candidatus Diapherotrites archaeon]MDZ4256210.1 ZPR1 zinc finger domain-containing protein [archaeon]
MPRGHPHESSSLVTTPCPQCGKGAKIVQLVEKVPHFGKMMIQTVICEHCGFRFSDVMSLEFNQPMGFEIIIKDEKGLSAKLIRNSSGTVEIPQIGFRMEPGMVSEGFYTNIEGLLERVEMVLDSFIRNGNAEEKNNARAVREIVTQFREGKTPFTVRVLDPDGGSAILGERVKKWKLTEKEIAELGRGITLV